MILNSPYVSGSLTVTGNIIASGSITLSGSVASASFAASASNALAAQTASTTPNAVTTASISGPTISFSKGNASTFDLTVNNVTSASYSNASTNTTLLNNTASTVFATTGSNILTGTQYISNTNDAVGFSNTTSSIYTDGGFQVTKNAYFSSSMFIKGNLTVFGTQSVSFITSSQLNISTNVITVNTNTPSVRFGGLSVYDSGSTGTTGSIFWDSQNNHWVYTNPSGSSYSGGMFISGPRASSLGEEQGTTLNAIMKGQGGDHITSSAVFEVSGSVGIGTSSPSESFHVHNGNSLIYRGDGGRPSFSIYNNTANNMWQHIVQNSGRYDIRYRSSFNTDPDLTTGSISITNTGLVGIGTTNPQYRLHVQDSTSIGTIAIGNLSYPGLIYSDAGTGEFRIDNRSSTSGFISFYPNGQTTIGNERMRITSGGNVGIGITSPDYKLDIATSTQPIRIKGSSTGYTQGSLLFQSDTSSSPSSRGLGVYAFNEGTDATWFFGNGYNAADAFVINRKSGSTYQEAAAAPGESSNFLLINSSGNIGISTTSINSNVKLKVKATSEGSGISLSSATFVVARSATDTQLGIGYYTTPAAWVISSTYGSDGAYQPLAFATSDIERVRITSDGNLAFNTAGSGAAYVQINQATSQDGGLLWYRNNVIKWQNAITNPGDNMNWYSYTIGNQAFAINTNGSATLYGALTQNASDRRLKNNITNIPNALDKIKTLNGVTFNWENNIFKTERTNDIGVIAQEIQNVLPEAVTLAPFDDDGEGNSKSGENYLTVYYEKLIPLLIEGVKELKAQNDDLQSQINELKA
jgi:hypothetical protein